MAQHGADTKARGDAAPASRLIQVLSILYLAASIISLSIFANAQMNHTEGMVGDPHHIGAVISALAAALGVAAVIISRRHVAGGRNNRTALLAIVAGAVIFAVGAAVLEETPRQIVDPGTHSADQQ